MTPAPPQSARTIGCTPADSAIRIWSMPLHGDGGRAFAASCREAPIGLPSRVCHGRRKRRCQHRVAHTFAGLVDRQPARAVRRHGVRDQCTEIVGGEKSRVCRHVGSEPADRKNTRLPEVLKQLAKRGVPTADARHLPHRYRLERGDVSGGHGLCSAMRYWRATEPGGRTSFSSRWTERTYSTSLLMASRTALWALTSPPSSTQNS